MRRCRYPALAMAAMTTGCAGGAALMHPAHTLPTGAVTFGAGASEHFVIGDADHAVNEAILARTSAVPSRTANDDFVRGAIAWSLLSPGLAPWVGARVGVGSDVEAGLTYTGRAARLDGRYAFETDTTALSLGLGLSSRLLHPQEDTQSTGEIPDLNDGGVAGVGFDVPVIVGWRSSAQVVQVYGGARGGFESLFGTYLLAGTTDDEDVEADLQAQRWFVGGLAGLIVGVAPVWVGIELDAAYHRGSGDLSNAVDGIGTPVPALDVGSGAIDGWSLCPTGVIIGRFD